MNQNTTVHPVKRFQQNTLSENFSLGSCWTVAARFIVKMTACVEAENFRMRQNRQVWTARNGRGLIIRQRAGLSA